MGVGWSIGIVGFFLPSFAADRSVMPAFVATMWILCAVMIPCAGAAMIFSILALRRPQVSSAGTVVTVLSLAGVTTTVFGAISLGVYAFLLGLVRWMAVVH